MTVKKTRAEMAGSDYCINWCRCTVHQAKIYRLALQKISGNYSLKSSSWSLSVEFWHLREYDTVFFVNSVAPFLHIVNPFLDIFCNTASHSHYLLPFAIKRFTCPVTPPAWFFLQNVRKRNIKTIWYF